MTKETVKNTTIKETIYNTLIQEISHGVYKPGQQMNEVEITSRFKCSRSPVREALRHMVSEGILVEYPNRGVFVRSYTAKDIEDIFDLRILLESYAITNCKKSINDELIAELLQLKSKIVKYMDMQTATDEYIEEDTILHNTIVKCCGNNLVIDTYKRIQYMIQQFRIYSLFSNARYINSIQEHVQIIENIISGNYEEANQINVRHLTLAKNAISHYLTEFDKVKRP